MRFAGVTDEPRVGGTVGVRLSGTGFAPDGHSTDLCGRTGTVVDHILHHLLELFSSSLADRTTRLLGLDRLEHLEVASGDALDHVRLHQHPVVGDGGGHHQHLQRGGCHLVLPNAGLRQIGGIHLGGEVGSRRRQVDAGNRVETETLRHPQHLVLPQFHTQLRESSVAGRRQRVFEGGLRASAVRGIADAVAGTRCLVAGRGCDGGRGFVPGLQGSRRGQQFEGGTGGIDFPHRAVLQRLGRIVNQGVPVLRFRRGIGGSQEVRVVGGGGDQCQDLAGGVVDGDGSPLLLAQGLDRGGLRLRVQRRVQVRALRFLAREQVNDPGDRLRRRGAGQFRVPGALQFLFAVGVRIPAGYRRVHRALGVGALPRELS